MMGIIFGIGMMRTLFNWCAISILLVCSGCKADMSDARRDHLLAGDHGWIDLTVHAPAQAPGFDPQKACRISLLLNGEAMLGESADLAQAEASHIPLGYRFVAPAGKLQAELNFSACVKDTYTVKYPLVLEKDQLANMLFDGKAVSLQSTSAYEPTSLEWVRAEMLKLQADNAASGSALSMLTKIAIASLVLNALTLLYFLGRQRRK